MYQPGNLATLLQVYQEELTRCVDRIKKLDPSTEEYRRVLDAIDTLEWKASPERYDEHELPRYDTPEPSGQTATAPIKEWTEEVKLDTKPNQNVVPGSLNKEQLRAMLVDAANNGVQIQPILEKFIPEGKPLKFSEIPSSRYAELEEELRNAR